MKNIYIGIDVGTTSLKALALTEDGECIATSKRSYDLCANGAEATQNAEDWYDAAVGAIREIAENVKDIGVIRAISTSAQGGASALLDENGKTTRHSGIGRRQRIQRRCHRSSGYFRR